jgi:hypothetical protein
MSRVDTKQTRYVRYLAYSGIILKCPTTETAKQLRAMARFRETDPVKDFGLNRALLLSDSATLLQGAK